MQIKYSTIPDVLHSTIICFRESICAKSADTTGIGTQIKKHFAKMRSLHPPDAEHKGFGHSPTSVLNLDFEKSDSKIASWYQVALLAT